MSHRIERFSSTLKQCLGDILVNNIQDPTLQFLSISEVSVNPDLKRAKIYISSPGQDPEIVLRHLHRAKGYFKKQLPVKMSLKYIPELEFKEDSVYQLDQKLAELEKKK